MDGYHNQTIRRRQKNVGRQPRRGQRRLLLAVILLAAIVTGHVIWDRHVSAEAFNARQAEAAVDARKAATFSSQVNALLAANQNITFSISTISQTNGLQHYGTATTFDAASTGKLLTAADFLHHVEQHSASLNQTIDGQNAKYLLQIMLVDSNDTAWADLNDYLTHANLQQYAASLGITDYDANANLLSSNDIALILQKLYARQLLNNTDSSLMLGYLKQANYREFIVPAVPAGDTVYHKVGEDGDNVHDAAIITRGQHVLILVIYTNGNGTYEWTQRAQLMQTITRDALAAYL